MAQTIQLQDFDGQIEEVTLNYDLKKTCKECPYVEKMKGWIGEHESAKEFHDIAKYDVGFPCHMHKAQSCVGNALYMNQLKALSRDHDKSNFQKKLEEENEEKVIFSWDGQALVDYHGR
jgi:hypothetical protein